MATLKMSTVASLLLSGVVSAYAAGTTYTTKSSGDWGSPATWNEPGIPVHDGAETATIQYHSVTNDDDALTVYQLNIGSKTNTQDARFVKKGGVFTSQWMTEVGNNKNRTWPSILEVDGGAAIFQNYRFTVGRAGGNAHVLVKDGCLVTEKELPGAEKVTEFLMGIELAQNAVPNTIELEDSVWTNRALFSMGYTSVGTNIIRLVRSTFRSEHSSPVRMGCGTAAGNTSLIGQCFLIAEDDSRIEVPGASIAMPNHSLQSSHLIVSNSQMSVNWLVVGNKAGTTNSLALIDSTFSSGNKIGISYEPNTFSRVLLKDLKKEKQSASEMFNCLSFRSVAGEHRAADVEIVGGDWTSTDAFTACQAHNRRRFTFRDLTLPMGNIYSGNSCPTGEAELILSNCTCAATQLRAAFGQGTSGTLRIYDSIITNLSTLVVSDVGKDEEQTSAGDLLLSGGKYAVSSEFRIRAGTGRVVMERGAKATVNALYVPNLTGTSAYLEVADAAELLVTNNFCIGNQSQTLCEILVRDGGKILVPSTTPKFNFGANPAAFTFTISGEGSEARFPGKNTGFAVTDGTTGTLNLNGGLFETKTFGTPAEGANQIINFNGGIVKASESASLTQTYSKNYVDVGGAIIETSDEGHTVNLYGTLQHKGETAVTDGGLTKQGPGKLYLYVANTFNGPVKVREGTLVSACTTGAALPDGVSVTLDLVHGASLGRTGLGSYPASMTIGVENAAALDPEKKYKLAGNWDPSCEVTFDLPQDWKVYQKGGDLMAGFRKGVVLIVR